MPRPLIISQLNPGDMKTEKVISNWLNDITRTAAEHDHTAHMNLISENISLTGVPGFENLGYDDWSNQCQHDFNDKLIDNIHYTGLKVRAATETRIMFMTFEAVTASDGTVNAQGIECLLEKEDDDQWRLVQQRVLSDEETAQYQLKSN